MRLATTHRYAVPTVVLALACAAVLAVVSPVSADPIVGGDQTVPATTTSPAVQVTPDGDLITKPSDSMLPAVTSAKAVEAQFRKAAIRRLRQQILRSSRTVQKWDAVMGVRPAVVRRLAGINLRQAARIWNRRAKQARDQAQHPPHYAEFMCIHRYEGSWTDSGAPYWGGLQMNLSFMATYGGQLLRVKGTANHWTPLEQIWAAEKAERSRGFGPWPLTARYCGLI